MTLATILEELPVFLVSEGFGSDPGRFVAGLWEVAEGFGVVGVQSD